MNMNTNTNNGDENNGGDPLSDNIVVTGQEVANNEPVDPFEKHINIALEAQDGKADATGGEDESTEGTPTAPQGQPDAENSQSGGGNKSAQQQPAQQQQGKAGTGNPKDLTLADGTVVKAGAERRFYEQYRVAKDRVSHLEQQVQEVTQREQRLQSELQTLQQTVQTTQGMSPQDLGNATTLFRDLNRDPVGTLQKLLAGAIAAGYKIEGIQTGLDAAAIERIIENRLGSTMQQQQEPSEAEIMQQAQHEASQFFARYPDARPHDALIAKVMRDNPGVDLNTAYFSLREQFAARGFDWNRPLDEQLLERNAQQSGNTQQSNQQQPGLPASRPNIGDASTANGDGRKIAHESTDMDSIIRSSMREAGLNV